VSNSTPDGLGRWGWFHIIESLAGRDITKFDMVLDRRCYEVFTHLTYMMDYAAVERQQYDRMRHGI
jgi:hypothetical protein